MTTAIVTRVGGDDGWRLDRGGVDILATINAETIVGIFNVWFSNADVVRQDLERERGITVSLRTLERAVAPFRRELAAEAKVF